MSPLRILTFAIPFLFALAACTGGEEPAPTPTPTPPFGLPPLVLPSDEEPHGFSTEWWYFNLHLTSREGERFTLHDVVFQVREPESGRSIYVRQTGLGDIAAGTHANAERLLTGQSASPAEENGFLFEMGDWTMSGSDGESYQLQASSDGYSYALSLTDTTTPLLHGERGLVDFDFAGVSYYYSRPRLEVEGTLTTPDGREIAVTGLGWLDKQWGDFQPVIIGWDWASVQLDDGTDVMLSRLFDMERNELHLYATVRGPGEEQEHIGPEGLEFTPLHERWTSPETGITYRTNWHVRIPAHDLEFTLVPLVEGSEFASQVLGVTYWEAGVDAIAPDGSTIGQGFVELNWPRGAAAP